MSANYFELLKYAATGIASPDMTYYDKMRASTLMGGVVQTLTGQPPLSFTGNGKPLISWSMLGNGQQSGTPSPDNIIMPEFVGVRTGNILPDSGWTNGQYRSGVWELTESRMTSDYIPIGGGLSYTLSINNGTELSWLNLNYFDSDKQWLGNRADLGMGAFPPTAKFLATPNFPNSATYLRVTVRGYNESGYPSMEKIRRSNVQVNLGSITLPYEPFGYKIPLTCAGQTTPVYLGEVPTVRRVKKYEFTGQETMYEYGGTTGVGARIPMSDMMQNMRANGFCTHFVPFSAPSQATGDNITFGVAGSNYIYILMSQSSQQSTGVSDFTGFKSYLASEYSAGHPVTVWYVLAEPTTGIVNEPLAKIGDYADELHSEDTSVTIPTTKGQNTLTVDTDLQPSEMTITFKG